MGNEGRRIPVLRPILTGAVLAAMLLVLPPAAAQSLDEAQPLQPPAPGDAAPVDPAQLPTEPPLQPGTEAPASCPVKPLPYWSESEKYAWEAICLRRWADLPGKYGDPSTHVSEYETWNKQRRLSAAFLLRIMTDPVFVEATPFTGIRIDGAYFPEGLYLTDLEYNKPLDIINSVFEGAVEMQRYRSRARVRIAGCWFRQHAGPDGAGSNVSFDASGLEVAKSVDLSNSTSAGLVHLVDARVGLHLDLSDASFHGAVRLDRARIGSMLYIERTTIADSLTLEAADIGQNILMTDFAISKPLDNGDTEYGELFGSQLHVAGHMIVGGSDKQIAMPARLVGQSIPAAAPAEATPPPPPGEDGSGGNLSPTDLATSLPQGDAAEPIGGGDLTAGSLAGEIAAAVPPREYSVRAWRFSMTGARIDGELRIRRLRLLGRISLEDAVVGDDLWLTESDFDEATLSAVSVKGFLLLHGSHITNALNLDSGNIGRTVVMDPDTRMAALRMPGAAVKGSVYFAGAQIGGVADLNSIAIDRDLVAGAGTKFGGPTDASFARIGGSLDLTGGRFARVSLRSATIDRDLALGGAGSFDGPLDASFAQIGGSLDLTGGRFASVDLTGAEIAGELRLAAAGTVPHFAREAELNLRNATVNSLQDVAQSWPCVLHLEGFTYQRQIRSESGATRLDAPDPCAADAPADASERAVASAAAATDDPKAAREAADARRAEDLRRWLARQEPFSPQPYVQLANVLRQTGDNETAKAILYAGKQREFAAAGFWSSIGLALQWAFTGFGLYPQVAGLWVLALIAIGAVVFSFDSSPELRRFTPGQRVIYSFDMLIPAVHLRHHHAEIELQSWPRYYLYGHKLMGYVLLTFLAAALLGLGGLE